MRLSSLAARLEAVAPPNCAVLSVAAASQTSQFVSVSYGHEGADTHDIKGLGEKVPLLQLIGPKAAVAAAEERSWHMSTSGVTSGGDIRWDRRVESTLQAALSTRPQLGSVVACGSMLLGLCRAQLASSCSSMGDRSMPLQLLLAKLLADVSAQAEQLDEKDAQRKAWAVLMHLCVGNFLPVLWASPDAARARSVAAVLQVQHQSITIPAANSLSNLCCSRCSDLQMHSTAPRYDQAACGASAIVTFGVDMCSPLGSSLPVLLLHSGDVDRSHASLCAGLAQFAAQEHTPSRVALSDVAGFSLVWLRAAAAAEAFVTDGSLIPPEDGGEQLLQKVKKEDESRLSKPQKSNKKNRLKGQKRRASLQDVRRPLNARQLPSEPFAKLLLAWAKAVQNDAQGTGECPAVPIQEARLEEEILQRAQGAAWRRMQTSWANLACSELHSRRGEYDAALAQLTIAAEAGWRNTAMLCCVEALRVGVLCSKALALMSEHGKGNKSKRKGSAEKKAHAEAACAEAEGMAEAVLKSADLCYSEDFVRLLVGRFLKPVLEASGEEYTNDSQAVDSLSKPLLLTLQRSAYIYRARGGGGGAVHGGGGGGADGLGDAAAGVCDGVLGIGRRAVERIMHFSMTQRIYSIIGSSYLRCHCASSSLLGDAGLRAAAIVRTVLAARLFGTPKLRLASPFAVYAQGSESPAHVSSPRLRCCRRRSPQPPARRAAAAASSRGAVIWSCCNRPRAPRPRQPSAHFASPILPPLLRAHRYVATAADARSRSERPSGGSCSSKRTDETMVARAGAAPARARGARDDDAVAEAADSPNHFDAGPGADLARGLGAGGALHTRRRAAGAWHRARAEGQRLVGSAGLD